MKTRIYTIEFSEPISQEQEDILVGSLKGMLEQMEESLSNVAKGMTNSFLGVMMRGFSPAMIAAVKSRVKVLITKDKDGRMLFKTYYNLQKKSSTLYTLQSPDKDELMGIQVFTRYIPMADNSLTNFLKETIKDMGVKDGGCKITINPGPTV